MCSTNRNSRRKFAWWKDDPQSFWIFNQGFEVFNGTEETTDDNKVPEFDHCSEVPFDDLTFFSS